MADDKTNPDAAGAEAAAAKGGEPKTIKGRVLVDTGEHRCNRVISLPAAEAKAAAEAGWLDINPNAVKAAEAEAKHLDALDEIAAKARGEAAGKAAA